MDATTEYGDWHSITGEMEQGPRDAILNFVSHHAGGLDLDEVERRYREAINSALPDGVSLNGDLFHGPYRDGGVPGDVLRAMALAVDGVDLGGIIESAG